MEEEKGYDLRWRAPTTQMLVGSSGSGKTTFIQGVLKHKAELFTEDPCLIVYYYKEAQPAFQSMKRVIPGIKFIQGSPESMEDVKEALMAAPRHKHKLLVFDDVMDEHLHVISHVFTVFSHHGHTSAFFLAQAAFDSKRPEFRTISTNAKGIVLFRNPRDRSIVSHLSKQISPGNTQFLTKAYAAATKTPFSYLYLDFAQHQSEHLRVRSHILPEEWPMRVYAPPDTFF